MAPTSVAAASGEGAAAGAAAGPPGGGSAGKKCTSDGAPSPNANEGRPRTSGPTNPPKRPSVPHAGELARGPTNLPKAKKLGEDAAGKRKRDSRTNANAPKSKRRTPEPPAAAFLHYLNRVRTQMETDYPHWTSERKRAWVARAEAAWEKREKREREEKQRREEEEKRGWALNEDDDIVVAGGPTKGGEGTRSAAADPAANPSPVLAIGGAPGSSVMEATSQTRRSTCVCASEQCNQLSKAFQSLNDVRGQYFSMPKQGRIRSAGLKLHKLDRTIHHLKLGSDGESIEEVRARVCTLDNRSQKKEGAGGAAAATRSKAAKKKRGRPKKGEASGDPDRVTRRVANHHFHPGILQEMMLDKGQSNFDFVERALVQRLGLEGHGYAQDDLWRGKIGKREDVEVYVPVPSYGMEEAQRDYVSCSSRRRLDALVSTLRNKEPPAHGEDSAASAREVDEDASIRRIDKLPPLDMNNALHMQSAVSVLADESDRLKDRIKQLEERLEAEREATAARERSLIEEEPTTAERLQPYFDNGKPFFVQAFNEDGWVAPEDGTPLEFETRTHKRSVAFERSRFVPGIRFANLQNKCRGRYTLYKRPGMWKGDRKEKKREHTQSFSKALVPRGIIEVCVREKGSPPPAFWSATGADVSPEDQESAEAVDEGYINDDGYYDYQDA